MRRLATLFAVTAALVPVVVSAQSAGAPTTVTDVRKSCQLTVPAGWTVQLSTAYSPDKKISATVNGAVARGTFAEGKTLVQSVMKPVKVVQDDAKRMLYTFDPGATGAGKTGWYAVVNSTPVCATSLLFPAGTDEKVLRSVVDSLAPVKK